MIIVVLILAKTYIFVDLFVKQHKLIVKLLIELSNFFKGMLRKIYHLSPVNGTRSRNRTYDDRFTAYRFTTNSIPAKLACLVRNLTLLVINPNTTSLRPFANGV